MNPTVVCITPVRLKAIPTRIPKIIETMIFFVNDIII